MLPEERRPLLVDQLRVRLDRVGDPLMRQPVLLGELDGPAEEVEPPSSSALRRTGIEDRIGPDRFCFTVVAAATAFEREEEEATPRSGDP